MLQLLLRHNEVAIEHHLSRYIDDQKMFVQNQIPDLCMMVVRCLEDSILAKERNFSSDRRRQEAIKHMKQRLEQPDDSSDDLVTALRNLTMDR